MEVVKARIGNALTSVAPDHVLGVANDIFDEDLQMYQSDINRSAGVFDVSDYYSGQTFSAFTQAVSAVPQEFRKGGMTMQYVQTSDNKYIQARLMAQNFTTDITQWAIAEEGVYVENPEFIYVKTDAENRILWAIKTDGGIYYGAGVPQQVIDYIEEKIAGFSLDEYEDIVTFLIDYLGGDATLKSIIDNLANTKVDKVVGKSLIDAEYAEGVSQIENPEFAEVHTDADDKILYGVKQDGDFYFGAGVPSQIQETLGTEIAEINETKVDKEEGKGLVPNQYIQEIESQNYVGVWTDSNDRILLGIKENGDIQFGFGVPTQIVYYFNEMYGKYIEDIENRHEIKLDLENKIISYRSKNGVLHENVGIETPAVNTGHLELTEEGMSEFQQALKDSGFEPGGKLDFSDKSYIYIPTEPTCATVNISGVQDMPASKTADYHAYFEYWDNNGNYFKKKIILNAQGRSSLQQHKHNFGIDICEDDWIGDDTTTVKIGNWVSQDSFHFKAFYTDLFKFVNVISYKLYLSFAKTMDITNDKPYKEYFASDYGSTTADIDDFNQNINEEAKCVPDGFPCMVYLNGSFYGLFTWQLKKHRDNYHLDRNATDNIHIDGDDNYVSFFSGNYATEWNRTEIRNPKPKKSKWTLTCMDGSKYDGDDPKELIDNTSPLWDNTNKSHTNSKKVKESLISLSTYMQDIAPYESAYNAIVDKTSLEAASALATLKEEIEKRFGVRWMIDYLILMNFTRNTDAVNQNGQWITWGGEDGLLKWYVLPYDCDNGFGINSTTSYSFSGANFERKIGKTDITPLKYVFDYYLEDMKDRYKELRDSGVLSYDAVIGMIREWINRIGYDNFELEYDAWPESPCNRDGGFNDKWEQLPRVWNQTYFMTWGGNASTYSSSTSYSLDAKCKYNNRMFISKQNNNVGHVPVGDVSDEWWEDACPKPGTYNQGDEVWDGRNNFYKFRAKETVTIVEDAESNNRPDHLLNTPFDYLYEYYPTEGGVFDSIYRISSWIKESIADMDSQFNYNNV